MTCNLAIASISSQQETGAVDEFGGDEFGGSEFKLITSTIILWVAVKVSPEDSSTLAILS